MAYRIEVEDGGDIDFYEGGELVAAVINKRFEIYNTAPTLKLVSTMYEDFYVQASNDFLKILKEDLSEVLSVDKNGDASIGRDLAAGGDIAASGNISAPSLTADKVSLDTVTGDDFDVENNGGTFRIRNTTDARDDLVIDGDGDLTSNNLDALVVTATDVTLSSSSPVLSMRDTDGGDWFAVNNTDGEFRIENETDARTDLAINGAGDATFGGDVLANSLNAVDLNLSGPAPTVYMTDTDGGDYFIIENLGGSFRVINGTDIRTDLIIDGAGDAVFAGDLTAVDISATNITGENLALTAASPVVDFDGSSGDNWQIGVIGGLFKIRNTTDSRNDLTLFGDGTFLLNGKLTVNDDIDCDALKLSSATPKVTLEETVGDDYDIENNGGTFRIRNITDARDDLSIDGAGATTLGGDLTAAAVTADKLTLDSADPELKLKDATGDEYIVKNNAGSFQIRNNTDGRTDVTILQNGFVLIGYTTQQNITKLQVQGNASKSAGGTSWATISDGRLKEEVSELSGCLEMFAALRGIKFHWLTPEEHGGDTSDQAGLIAQEVEQVIPEWVQLSDPNDSDSTKNFNPIGFEAHVATAFKEARDLINTLTARVETLEAALAS